MFGRTKEVAPPAPDELMTELARRGPHKVLRGDLGFVGVPGALFTPETGRDLPLVAFAHAWMADVERYRDLLLHMASHGIVIAAPSIESGFTPSDVALAAGLRTALHALPKVRLGLAESITVDPARRGLAGHGFGASAAVLAAGPGVLAATDPVEIDGLAAVFPAPSTALAVAAAETVRVPAMVLAAGSALDTVTANPLPMAHRLGAGSAGGEVSLRSLPGASDRGLLQQRNLKSLIGINGADKATHATVRALLTGFFLATLTDDDKYSGFADPDAEIGDLVNHDPDGTDEDERSHTQKLLNGPPKEKKSGGLAPIRALRGT